jgi:uncharacterized membrane protein YiaA
MSERNDLAGVKNVMNRLQVIKKIYSSTWIFTIIYGLPFGLLTYILSNKRDHSTIVLYLVGGLLFGALMNLSQRKRFKKVINIAEAKNIDKNKTFNSYLKHSQVPESKTERQELLSYMDKLESHRKTIQSTYYSKPHSKRKNYVILTLLFIGTVTIQRLRVLAIVYPVIMGIGLYGEYHERTITGRIANMRDKLKP